MHCNVTSSTQHKQEDALAYTKQHSKQTVALLDLLLVLLLLL
jgi:hypothetical protein